jgi:photosystem II stability/assembly factor-like uncharacterized protein
MFEIALFSLHPLLPEYTSAMRAALVLFAFSLPALGQWTLQESHSTASLRGIHSLGGGVAWASGSGGTVLRTVDNGKNWEKCAVPEGAEKLDFRGVQAFDGETAIVMSSGKGDLSRLYKTSDGCKSWKLLVTNPDPEGFWDAIHLQVLFDGHEYGVLLGDPVDGEFVLEEVYPDSPLVLSDRFRSAVDRQVRKRMKIAPQDPEGRGAFAASNSSLVRRSESRPLPKNARDCIHSEEWFGTGGPNGAKVFRYEVDASGETSSMPNRESGKMPRCSDGIFSRWIPVDVPIAGSNANSGVFSLALSGDNLVAVGGDYTLPNSPIGTAAFTNDEGQHWQAAATFPHGYRSAVAYSPVHKAWITVGPNGTDVSTDGGRNWRALRPSAGEAADADQHWNALSLPFVVGAHGRIGILREDAIQAP